MILRASPIVLYAFLFSLSGVAVAKSTLLQTADLNDKNMSTEGGYAKLISVITSKGSWCRIEAIHYGEGGKTTYTFTFGSKLYTAEVKEYDYDHPIYMDPDVQIVRSRITNLQSGDGRRDLPKRFNEYKSFFSGSEIARCTAGRPRR